MAVRSDATATAVHTWCVGIDFGTRTCSAALLCDSTKLLDIPLSGQEHSLPSYVTVTDNGFFVGASARTRARSGDSSTVFDFVRLVGRKVCDLRSSDRRKWPFTVVSDENDKAVIEIHSTSSSAVRRFDPEELAAVLFRHIKEQAEALAQVPIETAIVCIPGAFNHSQRCAVRNACAIAGLRVERLVSSATAAIASLVATCTSASGTDTGVNVHIETTQQEQQELVLAVDVGASCTDVALVAVHDHTLDVQATDSELHLGGDDVTDRIAAHCWRRRRKPPPTTPAATAPTPSAPSEHTFIQSANQLRHACELAKKLLAVSTTAVVAIDAPVASDTFSCYTLTRASVDALCDDLFQEVLSRTLALVRDCVTTVLLLGGSAQIPKLAALFRTSFHDKRVLVSPSGVSPARGAAALSLLELHEVTPLALGIQSVGGTRIVMIPRNTPVPVHEASLYYANCQHAVIVHILEGRSFSAPSTLHRLASIRVGNSTHAATHLVLQLDLAFEVATLDHVSVSVVERASGRRVTTQLVGDETSLSAADVARAHARLYGRIGDSTPMVFVPRDSVLQIPHLTGTSLLSTQDPIQLLYEYVAALEAAATGANIVLSREDAALVRAVGVALSASQASRRVCSA